MSDYVPFLKPYLYEDVAGIVLKYLREFKGNPKAGFGFNIYEFITLANGIVVYTCEDCPYIYFWSNSEQRAIRTHNRINISLLYISGTTFAAIYDKTIFIYEGYELKDTIVNGEITWRDCNTIENIIIVNGRYWYNAANELHIDTFKYNIHDGRISNIVYSGNSVIISDWSGHITVYSGKDGKTMKRIEFRVGSRTEFDYFLMAADNSLRYAHNNSLFFRSISGQKEIKQSETISHMGLLYNGNLIVGDVAGVVNVYDSDGKVLKTFSAPGGRIICILELHCGNLLVSTRISALLVNSDGVPLKEIPGLYIETYQLPDGKVVMADDIVMVLE